MKRPPLGQARRSRYVTLLQRWPLILACTQCTSGTPPITTIAYPSAHIAHAADITHLTADASGSTVVSGDFDGFIRAWRTSDCSLTSETKQSGMVDGLAVSPDGQRVAWFRLGLHVGSPKALEEAPLATTTFTSGALTFFNQSKSLLVSGKRVGVLDLDAEPPSERLLLQDEGLVGTFLTPDEQHVVALNFREEAFVVSVATGELKASFRLGRAGYPVTAAFGERSPGHYFMAVGSDRGDVLLSLVPEGRLVAMLSERGRYESDREVTGLAFRMAEDRLLAVDEQGRLTFWSVSQREPIARWESQAMSLYQRPLLVAENSSFTPTEPNQIRVSELPSGTPNLDIKVKGVRTIRHLVQAAGRFVAAGDHEIFSFDEDGALLCVCSVSEVRP